MSTNITFVEGNIFNTKCQTVVNTVNCVGVMGKGIALVYKLRYPAMFDIYKSYCSSRHIDIGKLWLYKGEPNDPWVLNFPTKKHWKFPSKIEYVVKGLEKFVATYREKGITSIAFPLLGTHNGGLDKDEVLSIMTQYLSQCDIPVEIYEYDPKATDDLFERFKMTWDSLSDVERKSCGLKTITQIKAVAAALSDDSVQSMIDLINHKGVGLKTLECCFKMVMNYKKQQTIF